MDKMKEEKRKGYQLLLERLVLGLELGVLRTQPCIVLLDGD